MKPTIEKRNVFFKAAGIIALLGVVVFIGLRKRQADSHSTAFNLSNLFTEVGEETVTRSIQSGAWKNDTIYLQFINARDPLDVALFQDVIGNWQGKNVRIVGVVSANHSGLVPTLARNALLVDDPSGAIRKKVLKKYDANGFFLFTGSGELLYSGKNAKGYEEGPKVPLLQVVEHKGFDIAELVPSGKSISTIQWLTQMHDFQRENRDAVCVFALMKTLCDSCSSGEIVRFLEYIHAVKKYPVVLFLPGTFSSIDLAALRSQSKTSFDVRIADERLNRKWMELMKRFRASDLTDIVFSVDLDGRVRNVYHPRCLCWNAFTRAVVSGGQVE